MVTSRAEAIEEPSEYVAVRSLGNDHLSQQPCSVGSPRAVHWQLDFLLWLTMLSTVFVAQQECIGLPLPKNFLSPSNR